MSVLDKHIIVKEEVKKRLERIKLTESLSCGHPVTWNELLELFAEEWEQDEAGVKP